MDGENGHKIMPESGYNPSEAKFCACLFWLVFHATEDGDFENIPPEITCPTERESDGTFHVRPLVASFLCNGKVYMKVCSQVFQYRRNIESLWDVIQELSNDGFYAVDSNDEAVTEERLIQQDAFDLSAHLALMDSIILAHVNQSLNIQQIVNAVSTFASFSAAKELPFDLEDALLLWLNKINSTNERRIHKTKSPEQSMNISPRRFRFKKDQVLEKPATLFPKLDDLQNDIADGKALLSMAYFYYPDALSYESIKLSNHLSEDDAICNIELFRELCAQHICTSVFALRTEDFIYKAPELKNNVIALLCEIFIKIEVDKDNSSLNRNSLESPRLQSNVDKEIACDDVLAKEDGEMERKISTNENLNPNNVHTIKDRNSEMQARKVKPNIENNAIGDVRKKENKDHDKVDMSIQDQLEKLKSLSSLRREEVPSDTVSNTAHPSNAGKGVKSRQPLLSKRSRKQLATLGDEDRSFSAENLSGMQLVDFDLNRSHSMTSVVGKANYTVDPSKSFRAWEGGKTVDDGSKQKNQKISLEFKPEPKQFRRHTPGVSTAEQNKGAVSYGSVYSDPASCVEDNEKQRVETEPGDTISGRCFHEERNRNKASFLSEENPADRLLESIGSSYSEEVDKFRADILQRTHEVKDEEDVNDDFTEPQFEEDDIFVHGHFSKSITSAIKSGEKLNKGASPRPNKLVGLNQENLALHSEGNRDVKAQDHDDDLSTIAETSEPSTPTVYSFNTSRSFEDSQSSHTIGSESASPQMSFGDSQSSPTIDSNDVTPLNSFTDTEILSAATASHRTTTDESYLGHSDRLAHSAVDGSNRDLQRQLLTNSTSQRLSTKNNDSQFFDSSAVIPRASYTILTTGMSVEAAKAAGLPIIGEGDAPDEVVVDSFSSTELKKSGTDDRQEEFVIGRSECFGKSSEDFDRKILHGDKRKIVKEEMVASKEVQKPDNRFKISREGTPHEIRSSVDTMDRKDQKSKSYKGMAVDSFHVAEVTSSALWNGKQSFGSDHLEEVEIEDASTAVGTNKTYLLSEDKIKIKKEQGNGGYSDGTEADRKDLNLTTTWSEMQHEKDSLAGNLKSPRRSKNQCIGNFVEGPIINWAQYAQSKEAEDFANESEGAKSRAHP